MKITIVIFSAIALYAQEKPAEIPPDQKKDIQILRLERSLIAKDEEIGKLDAQIRQLKTQLLGIEEHSIVKAVCDAQKIPFEKCKIDPDKLTVSQIPEPKQSEKKPGEQK